MLSYRNGTKYQVKFVNQSTTDFGGLFCIEKLLDSTSFGDIIGKNRGRHKLSPHSRFVCTDLLKLEVYKSLIDHRATTDMQFLHHDSFFLEMFETLPGKSTLNNFQNQMTQEDCVQLREGMMEWLQQYPELLYSENGYITLDADATDVPCYGQQEGIVPNKYYGSMVYLPVVINIFNGLLPFHGKLRSGDTHTTNNTLSLFEELDPYLEGFEGFQQEKVLERGDAGFQCDALMKHAEQKGRKFLYRIRSNPKVKALIEEKIKDLSFDETKRYFFAFQYQAASRTKQRVVVVQYIPSTITGGLFAEYQYFVTNVYGDEAQLYTTDISHDVVKLYQERGTAEHPFHDLKQSFQCGQTNAQSFHVNDFKFLVSIMAMQIYVVFRELYLTGTQLARSYFSTIFKRIISVPAKLVCTGRRKMLKMTSGTKKSSMLQHVLNQLILIPT